MNENVCIAEYNIDCDMSEISHVNTDETKYETDWRMKYRMMRMNVKNGAAGEIFQRSEGLWTNLTRVKQGVNEKCQGGEWMTLAPATYIKQQTNS